MAICIFPGTFNPIHEAHIKMAEFALNNYGFDKIILIPSYIPPHKSIDKTLAQHRLNMVKLATDSNPKLEVSDIEYGAEQSSYTLITVKKILELYNIKDKLNFLIGTDAFENLKNWYKVDELKQLVHFIVFPRCHTLGDFSYYSLNGFDFEFAPMDYIELSSTQIREHQGKNIKKVEDYIKKHGLYIS